LLLLSQSLPLQAITFTNYIILQGLVSYPLFFLTRLFPDYLICKFKQWISSPTNRARRNAELPDPLYFDYAVQYARESLAFAIGITYSSMAPIILPFTLIFFLMVYISAKYNFVLVYSKCRYEGVKMLPSVVNFIFVSLIIYQLTMMGVFSVAVSINH